MEASRKFVDRNTSRRNGQPSRFGPSGANRKGNWVDFLSRGGRVRERPWKDSIPAIGDVPARETPIAPWAGGLLQHWLLVRSEREIPGEMRFPSTGTGKPWSKQSQYSATRQLLAETGLDGNEGGTFKLRHSYAMRRLRRGTAPAEVARWLRVGVAVMDRYRHVVIGPVDVV